MFSNPVTKKSNITEANRHLKLLYDRLSDCENALQEQAASFAQKEEDYQEEIATLLSVKENEIFDLKEQLHAAESLVHHLSNEIQEKNKAIAALQKKADVLSHISDFKPMLEKLLTTLTYAEHDEGLELQYHPPQDCLTDVTGGTEKNNGLKNACTEDPAHTILDKCDVVINLSDTVTLNQDVTGSIHHMVNNFGSKSRDFSISDDQLSDDAIFTDVSGTVRTDTVETIVQ